jgi:hypothetical protein
MKCNTLMLLVLSAWLGLTSEIASSAQNMPENADLKIKSNEADGAFLEVQMRSAYAAGTTIPIQIMLVNRGKEVVNFEWETTEPFIVTVRLTIVGDYFGKNEKRELKVAPINVRIKNP